MLSEDHDRKADRLDASVARLLADEASILAIWGLMHASTHRLNAELHRAGITAERDECATNHAGEYVLTDGTAAPEAAEIGDLIHNDMPPVTYPSDPDWAEAVAALVTIESLAASALRSPSPSTTGLAEAREAATRFETALARTSKPRS